jgi:hypothetical protein
MKPRAAALVRALLRSRDDSADDQSRTVAPLTPNQARQIRDITHQRAISLGLPEPTAAVLADSVVGGIFVSG